MFVHVGPVHLAQDVPELPKAHQSCEPKADWKHCDHDAGVNLHRHIGVARAINGMVDQEHLDRVLLASVVRLACRSLEERARDRWKQELDDLCVGWLCG